ncbi:MAG: adenosine deaminase [Anaerolineae bacterium]|nr:adenosine deaminase [Anaerolineae bacterium]
MNVQPGGDWFDRVPKVELHLHLEGAIPLPALWALVQKYGGDLSVPDDAALTRRFVYRSFADFIDAWVWKNRFLREYEDFAWIAEGVARSLAAQNIRYAEVFCSPQTFAHFGLGTQWLLEAVRSGLARVPGIEVALVVDLIRGASPEQATATVEEAGEARSLGVIGIGIGGSEHKYPPEPFAPTYARARQLGLHTTAHAGEAAGPASVWGAIRALHVERIGHGVRAAEDPALVDYLAEHRIPLEMCPTSNVQTGVVPALREHPLRRYLRHGLVVTVNTDDPAMFGSSLAQEYRLLERELGVTREETQALMLHAVAASWMPEERKRQMREAIWAHPAWE